MCIDERDEGLDIGSDREPDTDPDDAREAALDEAAAHAALPAELDRRFARPADPLDELARQHAAHIEEAHGPILTRGDWERAERECSAGCCLYCHARLDPVLPHACKVGREDRPGQWDLALARGLNPHCACCRNYALGHNDRPCIVCGHYTNAGPGNAEPIDDLHPEARAAFVDGLAGLFSTAIRAGVSEEELRADFEGCLSVQAFGVTS